jgi:MinD superfamily P-loop ATPase
VKELVIISGKGGTGKTSITAALAVLAGRVVMADCDVDAPNLALVLGTQTEHTQLFSGGAQARIDPYRCTACGRCAEACRFGAIRCDGSPKEGSKATCSVDPLSCEGCGVCQLVCPSDAVTLTEVQTGQWFISRTAQGPMVHARLRPAAENSGKLVSLVRREARSQAERHDLELVLVDGPPGIGCPVIASINSADGALVVTEPSRSGLHDLKRICELTVHFRIPTWVCVNKFDLSETLTRLIEREAERLGAGTAGRISYSPSVTAAQLAGTTVVETGDGSVVQQTEALWSVVREALFEGTGGRSLSHADRNSGSGRSL